MGADTFDERDLMSDWINDSPDNAGVDKENQLKYLTSLIEKLESKQQELDDAQKEVDRINDEVSNLSRNVIPSLFDELGVKNLTLQNGRSVSIKSEWVGSISEGNKAAAMSWLEENGHGSIVKKSMAIELKKGESETATKIREWLVANKIFSFKEGASVHHSTLKSWINEQKAKGADLPEELFGCFQVKETKVK